MANKKNQYPVPKFRNLDEEGKYWQSHSPLMEGYEGKVQKRKQNRASFLSVRLTGEELAQLRERATYYGLGPSTYARQVLIQAMESPHAYSLPPSLLVNLCSRLHSGSGEPHEEYLQRLNKIYREYLKMQEAVIDQIVTLYPSDPLLEVLKESENDKIRR